MFIGVRWRPSDLARLDAWIAKQPVPRPSRPEAIRRLVEKALSDPLSNLKSHGVTRATWDPPPKR